MTSHEQRSLLERLERVEKHLVQVKYLLTALLAMGFCFAIGILDVIFQIFIGILLPIALFLAFFVALPVWAWRLRASARDETRETRDWEALDMGDYVAFVREVEDGKPATGGKGTP